MITRRRAAFDVGIQVVGRSFNVVLGAGVAMLLARGLGDRGYGQWASMLAIVGIVGYLGSLGLTQVTLRRIAAEPELEAEWFGALIALRMLLAVPAFALVLLVEVLNARDHQMLVAGTILALLVPIGPLTVLSNAYMLRVRNSVPVAVDVLNSVAWVLVVGALFFSDEGIVPYAFAFLVVTASTAALQVFLGLRLIRPSFAGVRRLWPPLIRTALPVAIGGMLVLSYGKIDQVIVFQLAGARDSGLYAAAYRLLNSAQFLPAAVLTTMFPLLSAANDDARLRRLVQLAADHLLMVSLPLLGFAIAASTPLIELLFGDSFAPAARALPALMAAFVVICFGYLAGNLTIVLGLQRRFVWVAVAALIFNVTLNLLLVGPYGFVAAAWVTFGTEVLVCSITLAICLHRIEMRLRVSRMLRTTVAAAAMTGLVAALAHAGFGIVVLAAASAVYVPLLMLVGALPRSEVVSLLSR